MFQYESLVKRWEESKVQNYNMPSFVDKKEHE